LEHQFGLLEEDAGHNNLNGDKTQNLHQEICFPPFSFPLEKGCIAGVQDHK
jgi:hypothetical protein